MTDSTIEYYNEHAVAFAESTAEVDVSHLYEPFLDLLPSGGRILDAGCGGGRDARHFLELGYEVEAFDASLELCRIASRFAGIDVSCTRFEDCDCTPEHFDGIWACASLLHLQPEVLPVVLNRFASFLKPGGVFYLSFKTLVDKEQAGARYFCPMNMEKLENLIAECDALKIHRLWETKDSRPDREDCWINALLVRL